MARGLKKIKGWKAFTFRIYQRFGIETQIKVQDFGERIMTDHGDRYIPGLWCMKFRGTPKLSMAVGSYDTKCGFEIVKQYPNSRFGKIMVKYEDTDS